MSVRGQNRRVVLEDGSHIEQEVCDLTGTHELTVEHLTEGPIDDGECLGDGGIELLSFGHCVSCRGLGRSQTMGRNC